jgi:hypothetical protein
VSAFAGKSHEVRKISFASPEIEFLIKLHSFVHHQDNLRPECGDILGQDGIHRRHLRDGTNGTKPIHIITILSTFNSIKLSISILSFLRRHYIWTDYIIGRSNRAEFGLPAGRYVGPFGSCLVAGLRDALTISSSHHAVLAIWFIIRLYDDLK